MHGSTLTTACEAQQTNFSVSNVEISPQIFSLVFKANVWRLLNNPAASKILPNKRQPAEPGSGTSQGRLGPTELGSC